MHSFFFFLTIISFAAQAQVANGPVNCAGIDETKCNDLKKKEAQENEQKKVIATIANEQNEKVKEVKERCAGGDKTACINLEKMTKVMETTCQQPANKYFCSLLKH